MDAVLARGERVGLSSRRRFARICKPFRNRRPRSASTGHHVGEPTPIFRGRLRCAVDWRRPVTPEAAGSSPVDPANYPSQYKGFPVRCGSLLANRPESAESARLQARAKSVVIPHPFHPSSESRIERNPGLSKRQGAGTPRPPAYIAASGGNRIQSRSLWISGLNRRAEIELNAASVVARLSCPLSCCQTAPVPRAGGVVPAQSAASA